MVVEILVVELIDSMTEAAMFFSLHTESLGEMAEEQQHIDHNFIYSRERLEMSGQWIRLGTVGFSPPREGRY